MTTASPLGLEWVARHPDSRGLETDRARQTMKMIEKRRAGRNAHFSGEKSGWIEICLPEP